jgi:hypothetical protein
MDIVFLLVAAALAGFVDAVAGGGGLIQVPALLTALPAEVPATIFGTNKGSAVFGTANAAWRFARRITLPWEIALPAAAAAFVFSFGGAMLVSAAPKELLRPLILLLLVGVFVYTLVRHDFGTRQRAPTFVKRQRMAAIVAGAVLGFYDGFFGPGAGSFMIFAFVRFFGLDFLRASSAAKIVNLATNLAALAWFVPTGHILWLLAGGMALFNIAGAQLGSRLAIAHGSGFVRVIFLVVTAVLIVKFGFDTLR